MQITRIECELGVTVNAGDFQSVKSTVRAAADVDRGEDAEQAYGALATFVRQSLIKGARDAHPDAVRKMLAGDARQIEATAQNVTAAAQPASTAEKRKPGRPPKAAAPAQALAETGDGDIGGLDKESELDEPANGTMSGDGLDELDDLMDGTAPTGAVVTKDALHEVLRTLSKAGGKGPVLEVLNMFKVGNLSQLTEAQYAPAKAAAEKLLGKIQQAAK